MPKVDNPILLDIPDHVETERLLLRVVRPGDGQTLYESVRDSRAEIKQWLFWALDELTPDKQEAFARQQHQEFILRKTVPMGIWERESSAFAGMVGVHARDWSVPAFEIGYWLRTDKSGHGYMTEAVKAMTDYTFTHLHAERILIRMDVGNRASENVAKRAGYMFDGTIRAQVRNPIDDTLRDMHFYSKLRDD